MSLSWLWLSPKLWNVRCPPFYQAKHSWARITVKFSYECSGTLSEVLSPELHPWVQLTLPMSWNHDTNFLSSNCQNDSTEGAALLCLGFVHSVVFGSWYWLDGVLIVLDSLVFTRRWFRVERSSTFHDRSGLGHGQSSSKDVTGLGLGARPWWQRVPGGRPRKQPVSWRRRLSFWFCLFGLIAFAYLFSHIFNKPVCQGMYREPLGLSHHEGDGWHCGSDESDLPNSYMWWGGRAEASLTSLFQALDLGSLRPSAGQLNQWPPSVNCVETVLM